MPTTTFINEIVLKRFTALIEENCLAHAYLFVGADFAGKTQTALAIAKLINCEQKENSPEQGFCDECSSCMRINKGSHPDVSVIVKDLEEETIKIEQIRQLSASAQLRPFESTKKIFIIKNAEGLTTEAGNALLKTLEEPSANSLFILTIATLEKVLDTIKSRCHMVYFAPLGVEQLKMSLIKDSNADKDTAHFLAYFSEGSLGRALRLKDAKLTQRKNEIINEFVFSRGNEPFLQTLVADKEKSKEAFDVLLAWYRDLMLIKSGVDEYKLINHDRVGDLKKLEVKYTFGELQEAIDEIVKTSQSLAENFNMKIAMTILKENLWRN